MNKLQFQRMREALRTIEFSNRSGSHIGCIRLNNNCSDLHNDKIIKLCKEFNRLNIPYLTEAKFINNSGKADIVNLATHEIYEVMVTETDESIEAKAKKYPSIFKILNVRK